MKNKKDATVKKNKFKGNFITLLTILFLFILGFLTIFQIIIMFSSVFTLQFSSLIYLLTTTLSLSLLFIFFILLFYINKPYKINRSSKNIVFLVSLCMFFLVLIFTYIVITYEFFDEIISLIIIFFQKISTTFSQNISTTLKEMHAFKDFFPFKLDANNVSDLYLKSASHLVISSKASSYLSFEEIEYISFYYKYLASIILSFIPICMFNITYDPIKQSSRLISRELYKLYNYLKFSFKFTFLFLVIYICTILFPFKGFLIYSGDNIIYEIFIYIANLFYYITLIYLLILLVVSLIETIALFFISPNKYSNVLDEGNLFSLSYTFKNRDINLSDELKKNRYFISKGLNLDASDYLSLVVDKRYKIVKTNVKLLYCPIENKTIEAENNDGFDVLLLDTTKKKQYSKIYLELYHIESKKIMTYKIEIENKQTFAIKHVTRTFNYHDIVINNFRNLEIKHKNTYNRETEFEKIKKVTSRHLNIYINKSFKIKKNTLNYLQANFGQGKTTFISEYANNYSKIYNFSLNSNDVRTSIYETLYFELSHNKLKLNFKLIIFFLLTFSAIFAPILISPLLEDKSSYIIFISFIVIIGIISFILFIIKDFLLAINITNKYIKEKSYIDKIMKYLYKNNILLVIEDFDRTLNLQRMEATLDFFSKLSEEFNTNNNNLEILVTGKDWNKYEKKVYSLNGIKINSNRRQDMFQKIFKSSNKLELYNEFRVLKKYYDNLYPGGHFNGSYYSDFRLLKNDLPKVDFSNDKNSGN